MYTDLWTYREAMAVPTGTITGFQVEATDGKIGHIDEASAEAGADYIGSIPDHGFLVER